jgi:hypothetical protein
MLSWRRAMRRGLAGKLVVRAVWRRTLQMPLAGGRRSAWVARRPWWQLAVFYWAVLGLPQLGEVLWLAPAQHHELPAGLAAVMVLESVIGASLVALVSQVAMRRQLQNREMLEDP